MVRRVKVLPDSFIFAVSRAQVATLALFVTLWLVTRSGRRSEPFLRWVDAFGTIAPIFFMGSAFWMSPVFLRNDLVVTIAVAHWLMTRAVIIPSSPRRTFVIGVVVALTLMVGTHAYYVQAADAHLPPPFIYTTVVAAWGSASVIVSTLASYTIYGLRQKVIDAAQIGQYTLEQKLGEGGMGVVYRARHAMLRRPTAVKLLPPDRAGLQNLARFEREVQLTSLLTHPNTIAIYDYGRTPEGVFYYAMEYLDGIDLEELVRRDGPQEPSCVVQILEQIAGALSEAHAAGLIHRDIKPANVILCDRGGVPGFAKVVDFGLVKSFRDDVPETLGVTKINSIMGTPLYMSPEAIGNPGAVDARSDIYSLGAVAYFLLTGQNVFDAASVVEVCAHHLHTAPVPPSERLGRALPDDLQALVMSCLEKDPTRRPQSARVVITLLQALGCYSEFTPEAATAWWNRVKNAPRPSDEPRPSTGSSRTLAIDWQARNPAPAPRD
jgi:serine/threonine-protein kinase